MTGEPGLFWFARHEARLAWRDTLAKLQGRTRRGLRRALIAMAIVSAMLHAIAYAVLSPLADALTHPDKTAFVTATASAVLTGALMLSQGMEQATRSFYARGDLDLILSSPVPGRKIFVVRLWAILAGTLGMTLAVIGPFVNVAAWLNGPRYLCAYGVLLALACITTSFAIATTALLFRLVGAARTRIVSQIMAAIFGAAFVICIQVLAIFSSNTLSGLRVITSAPWSVAAPGPDSVLWWPVRAAAGDVRLLMLGVGLALLQFLLLTLCIGAEYSRNVFKVAARPAPARTIPHAAWRFVRRSPGGALLHKELLLLRRDPWLLSQSLMQVLYLIPPALLLWRNFRGGGAMLLVPVIVMAAGQLAGGLAWLAISAEDAPDLIASAPVTTRSVLAAKIRAVLAVSALPVLPFAVALAASAPRAALATLCGAIAAAGASCIVQFAFRSQAQRRHFRRRQTSSRIATFAEALTSISIAGTASLAAGGSWIALMPACIAASILLGVWLAKP